MQFISASTADHCENIFGKWEKPLGFKNILLVLLAVAFGVPEPFKPTKIKTKLTFQREYINFLSGCSAFLLMLSSLSLGYSKSIYHLSCLIFVL